jgi:superfamily II DNA or RNA helicase
MKYQLRDEQLLCADRSSEALRRDRRTILCLGTGGGKTVTASHMIRRALDRGRKVWILCHREEIMFQFLSTLMGFDIHNPSLICQGYKYLQGQQLYLGMVETFKRRGLVKELHKDDLVVIDECHWGSYEEVVNRSPAYTLGLSATPKASGGRELKDFWGTCIMPVPMSWLLENKRLVHGITYSIEYDVTAGVKVQGKDYHERILLEEFKSPRIFQGVLEQYEKHAKGEKAICYNLNVQHSLEVCQLFRDAGYRACHIDGDTPRDLRKDYFESFANGRIDILNNVGIATTGYDEPGIQVVIKNYATVQLTKDKQCEGRGARTNQDKEFFKIIDMGRNYIRHGRYGVDEVDWIDIFQNPAHSRTIRGKDREKECKECGAVIEMHAGACPYCQVEYTKKEIEQIFFQKADTVEIKEYRIQQLPPHIRNKKTSQMSYEELKQYAEIMNYSDKWPGMQMAIRNKYKKKSWGK